MQRYLMICEKPSLMREVKACYDKHEREIQSKLGEIEFVALAGHICTNYEPNEYDEWNGLSWDKVDYPMIPAHWKIKMIQKEYNEKVMREIKSKLDLVNGLIVGTDSDVEGYGIYYLLETYLGITEKKALRFIEHSLTDEEILQQLLCMTDYHTDPIHKHYTQSFLMRSRADWLYGMNATRMMTTKMNFMVAVGRVKTPTIKLVYDNSEAIENFVPKNYYNLEADYGQFKATLTQDNKNPQKYDTPEDVPVDIPKNGIVESKTVKRESTHAPQLYDLAAIQTEAGKSLGYSPSETLDIIQSLYEKHKVISYPRTQCRFVSSEKAKEFPQMISQMKVFEDLADIAAQIDASVFSRVIADKKVVNDTEVNKESHDALLPTSQIPDLSKMSEREIKICHLIYKRLLAQFLPMVCEDKTVLITKHGDYHFIARGKIVIEQGWRVLYKGVKDAYIPALSENDNVNVEEFKIAKKVTTPPKRLTQATLLNAMEHIDTIIEDKALKKTMADSKGLGTPATRATIISDIIERGYVCEKKDGLYITDEGRKYIKAVEPLDITSPVFAAKMDTEIKKIQRGESDYNEAYDNMLDNLNVMCNQIDDIPEQEQLVDASCIKCGRPLAIDRYGYVCRECNVRIPRVIRGQRIDEDMVRQIMGGDETERLTFKKKDGKVFPAKLYWNFSEDKVKFDFSSGLNCPKCGATNIKLNNGGAFCDCGFKLFRNCREHILSDKEIERLINNDSLINVSMKKMDGTRFTGNIRLDENYETKIYWDKR